MRIRIDTRKSVEKNAAAYFERAKKAKKKLEGAKKAVALAASRIGARQEARQEQRPQRKKEWYERFRWFLSSDGILCVAGRDAGTNEQVVKKHAQPGDLVFHTDMAGSPFVVVKGKDAPESTRNEAAQFAASVSRAWKAGVGALEVFHVSPDQLSKTAQAGEYLGKGAFMVRGNVAYTKPQVAFAIGTLADGRVMGGPPSAVLHHCKEAYEILQGNENASDVAKRLTKLLYAHVDEIVAMLPPGGVKMGQRLSRR